MRQGMNMGAALAMAAVLGSGYEVSFADPFKPSSSRRQPDGRERLLRALGLPEGSVAHITHAEPLTKRQKRRQRGKAKP